MSLIQQLSTELGITPSVLTNALSVGLRQSQLDALRGIVEQARQTDATITATEEESLAPLRAQLQQAESAVEVTRSQRRNYIAALDASWNEARNSATSPVTVPTPEDVATGLGVE